MNKNDKLLRRQEKLEKKAIEKQLKFEKKRLKEKERLLTKQKELSKLKEKDIEVKIDPVKEQNEKPTGAIENLDNNSKDNKVLFQFLKNKRGKDSQVKETKSKTRADKRKEKEKQKIIKDLNNARTKYSKSEKNKILKRTVELLPFVRMEGEVFRLVDGYLDIYEISGRSHNSYTQDDINTSLDYLHKFFKSYNSSIKFIVMNFPANTKKQQEYFERKIALAENEILKEFLDMELTTLKNVEKYTQNVEFYLFVYGKDLKSINKKADIIENTISKVYTAKQIPLEKKIDLIYKLNNMNSPI